MDGIIDGEEIVPETKKLIKFINQTEVIKKIDIYIDSKKIKTITSIPWEYEFDFDLFKLSNGEHVMRIVGYDQLLNQGEDIISFKYKGLDIIDETILLTE